jgi:F-type H+-transporting ATPase subunit epsilon
VSVPGGVLRDVEVARVDAWTTEGAWTLLPRHADVAAVLRPGLLRYVPADADDGAADGAADGAPAETFLASDHGVLVKVGDVVRVASERAVVAGDLADATRTLREHLTARSEQERRARNALVRLEADLVRHLGEIRRPSWPSRAGNAARNATGPRGAAASAGRSGRSGSWGGRWPSPRCSAWRSAGGWTPAPTAPGRGR